MDINQLDSDLQEIANNKSQLKNLEYHSTEYDLLEELVHDLQDGFQSKYGDFLEEALSEVHDEYCPDNEILLPIAYIGDHYNIENSHYDVDDDQGVPVDVDDFDSKSTRLVLVPKPTRLVLIIDSNNKQEVWRAS